jgi:hypothetical protein
MCEEVLRCGLHQVDAHRHRRAERSHQTHVVIERQPRHHHAVVHGDPGRFGQRVEIRAEYAIGNHHALGLARGTTRVLQDHKPFRVGFGDAHVVGSSEQIAERYERRVFRRRRVEAGEGIVDQKQLGVTVQDAGARLRHKVIERSHTHRQRQHHRGGTGEPARLDRSDQLPRRWAENCNVIARLDSSRLKRRGDASSIVVQLRPHHLVVLFAGDENHAAAPLIGSRNQTSGYRRRNRSGTHVPESASPTTVQAHSPHH